MWSLIAHFEYTNFFVALGMRKEHRCDQENVDNTSENFGPWGHRSSFRQRSEE